MRERARPRVRAEPSFARDRCTGPSLAALRASLERKIGALIRRRSATPAARCRRWAGARLRWRSRRHMRARASRAHSAAPSGGASSTAADPPTTTPRWRTLGHACAPVKMMALRTAEMAFVTQTPAKQISGVDAPPARAAAGAAQRAASASSRDRQREAEAPVGCAERLRHRVGRLPEERAAEVRKRRDCRHRPGRDRLGCERHGRQQGERRRGSGGGGRPSRAASSRAAV